MQMLQILPREMVHILFDLLPITDKRNFTRCDRELYTKNKLINNYQKSLISLVKKKYRYIPNILTPDEKYIIEIIYDNYEHLIPLKSICDKNQLCSYLSPFMYFYCAVNKNFKILKQLLIFNKNLEKYILYGAAFGGHLDVLIWTRENCCKWDFSTCNYAVENGHLNVLKWAKENDYQWDLWTCSRAALNGQLDILKWARANGCKWDPSTCCDAAENGHLDVLKWARENGCPWNSWTCSNAAYNGHLEVLKWARGNGCEWDYLTCSNAAKNGHLDVLKWAKENGCPER